MMIMTTRTITATRTTQPASRTTLPATRTTRGTTMVTRRSITTGWTILIPYFYGLKIFLTQIRRIAAGAEVKVCLYCFLFFVYC